MIAKLKQMMDISSMVSDFSQPTATGVAARVRVFERVFKYYDQITLHLIKDLPLFLESYPYNHVSTYHQRVAKLCRPNLS